MSDQAPKKITRGHGDTEFEIFLEPTCPYSKRAFNKLQPLLAEIGESNLTIVVRFVSQPWHLFSGVVTRCILAATTTEGGGEAGWHVLKTVFSHREHFITNDEFSGPNMEIGYARTIAYISDLSGIDLAPPFKLNSVGKAMIWHTKYSRQNGVHFTPTYSINRIIVPGIGSDVRTADLIELVTRELPKS